MLQFTLLHRIPGVSIVRNEGGDSMDDFPLRKIFKIYESVQSFGRRIDGWIKEWMDEDGQTKVSYQNKKITHVGDNIEKREHLNTLENVTW